MASKKVTTYFGLVASLGCIVCRNNGYYDTPSEIHHIGNGTMGKKASDDKTIPLCFLHHRGGGYGVAVHAGRKAFESNFGTEQKLLKQVIALLCT